MKKLVQIPFEGYYESKYSSIHHYPTDDQGNELHGDLDCEEGYEVFTAREYTKIMERKLSELLENKDTSLLFESVSSPRAYNFSTDRIFAELDDNSVNLLRSIAHDLKNRELFSQYLIDNFKSRSGFSSYYSHYICDWFDLTYDELDHNHMLAYIHFALIDFEGTTAGDERWEWDIFCDLQESMQIYCYDHFIEDLYLP